MREVCGPGLAVSIPEDWNPVGDNGPYAVSPTDGNGYLQFCVAFSAGAGDDGEAMLEMVLTMAKGHELGEPRDIASEDGPLPLAAASFFKAGEFCRMWELKHGANLVSAVFVCREPDQSKHLKECESIVRSIRTGSDPSSRMA